MTSAAGTAALAAWAAACLAAIGPAAWPKIPAALDAFRGPVQVGPYLAAFWADTLRGAALVALAWLGSAAWGTRLLAWIRAPRDADERGRTPVRIAVGVGLAACGSLALGLCGLWHAAVMAALLPLGALDGVLARRAGRRGPPAAPANGAAWLRRGCLGLGLLLGVFGLTPETWSDSLYYHLNAPSDFMDAHKWVDRDEAVFRYPLLAESLYGPLMLLGGERAAALVNLSGFLLLIWLVRAAAARLAGEAAGWLAAFSLLLSDQMGFHLGHTNQGFYSALFAFLAVDTWARAEGRTPGAPQRRLVAGAALCWAMCAKYTAIAPAGGLLAWHALRACRAPRREAASLGQLAAGFAAAGAAFQLKGWLLTGNPVYPLVFGGLDWSRESSLLMRTYGCPGTDFDLRHPATVGRALLGFLSVQRPLGLFALPAILLMPLRPQAPFLVAWGGAVVVWAAAAPCFRFMLPAFPALAYLTALGLVRWLAAPRPFGLVARAALALIAAHGMVQAVAGADFHKRSFPASVGLETGDAYRARILTSYWRTVEAVNRLVPPRARVLASGEGRGYGFRPLVLHRGGPEDFPQILNLVRKARTPHDIGKRFRRRGSDFLLLNYVAEEYRATFAVQVLAWKPEELRRWWEFWRSHARLIWTDEARDAVNGGFALYAVERQPHAPDAVMPFLPGTALAVIPRPGEDGAAHATRLGALARLIPGVGFVAERRAKALLESGGSPELALASVREASRCAYPEPAKLHGLTGMALYRLNRYREAAAEFRRARELDPAEPLYARWAEALGGAGAP